MQISIIVRQLLAALGGFLAHHGATVDTDSTASLLAGIICVIVSLVWSAMAKAEMGDATKDIVKKVAGVLASQCVAALAGWLQADAGTAENPTALILLGANATLSHVRGHVPTRTLWLVACMCLVIPSCVLTPQQQAVAQQLVIPLGQVGLKALVTHGVIDSQDAILVGDGAATILSSSSKAEKLMRLSDLGLHTAASRGLIQPGDLLSVQEALAVIRQANTVAAKQPINVEPINSPPEAGDSRSSDF